MRALLFFLLALEKLKKYHKGDFAGHCSISKFRPAYARVLASALKEVLCTNSAEASL